MQVLKNSPKFSIFGIFNEFLSTQNVNVARFARNVEWDFLCDFQTLCIMIDFWVKKSIVKNAKVARNLV